MELQCQVGVSKQQGMDIGNAIKRKGRTYRKRKRNKIAGNSLSNDENYISFVKTLKNYDAKFSHLYPAYFELTGRGLAAKHAFRPGELIISLPRSIIINSNKAICLSSWLKEIFKNHQRKSTITSMQALILFLCEGSYNVTYDIQSKWSSYITCLPQVFDHLLFISPLMYRYFNPVTFKRANNLLNNCIAEYQAMRKLLQVSCGSTKVIDFFTLELYKWAWCCVNTRCVYCSFEDVLMVTKSKTDSYCLMPFLDLFNHDPNTSVTVQFNKKTNEFEIIGHQHIKKYEQVFINYGRHSNENLYLEYGFVGCLNNDDEVKITEEDFTDLIKTCTSNQDVIKGIFVLLKKWNLDENWSITIKEVTWSLSTSVKVLVVISLGHSERQSLMKLSKQHDLFKQIHLNELTNHSFNEQFNSQLIYLVKQKKKQIHAMCTAIDTELNHTQSLQVQNFLCSVKKLWNINDEVLNEYSRNTFV